MKIVCNPMDLQYHYQFKKRGETVVFKEAADPTLLLFKGTYYLFASMSKGFWYSDDLYDWKFHETPELPVYEYAPDVREVDDRVIFTSSSRQHNCSFYESADPLTVPFKAISSPFPWWDPDTFQDDDGRVYFYWGCTNYNPIYGVEVDRKTFMPVNPIKPTISAKVKQGATECIPINSADHGFERVGENNKLEKATSFKDKLIRRILGTAPYTEGPFMTKYDGKYYLQFATPGTQYNVYCDGVYVGESPLGPFHFQKHNPFSSVPGGFITGAGHGSTIMDKEGKYWHISTMRISNNEDFERRLGLFPCDFDKDGIMHCQQYLANYPYDLQSRKRMDWMLLDGVMNASSELKDHSAQLANDENIRTYWVSENRDNATLTMDLKEIKQVNAVQINFADYEVKAENMHEQDMVKLSFDERYIDEKQYCSYLLEGSEDGNDYHVLYEAKQDDTFHKLVVLNKEENLRYIRLSRIELPFGQLPNCSGLRVFGKGNGNKPQPVKEIAYHKEGELNLLLNWQKVDGAASYVVRYGIDKDKLYNSWQVFDNRLDLSFINKGQDYYVAVDTINENGISEGDVIYCK